MAPAAAHPVQVGRYHGWLFHDPFVAVPKAGPTSPVTELGVQLPAGGGKMRDLVIGARQLSDAALIKIAAAGLSS